MKSLSDADLARLEQACATTRRIEPRQDIFREADGGDHLHVLMDGWAARYRELSDGRRQFPALVLPGEVCDLDRLMLGDVNFGVVALTRCTVARVPLREAWLLLQESPPIASAFWRLLSIENAIANEWATSLGRRTARERLAHLLCELAVRVSSGDPASGTTIRVPMNQQDLADAIGLSVVHLNRSLQMLRAEELIGFTSGQMTILDWEGLRKAADFNPQYLHRAPPPPSSIIGGGIPLPSPNAPDVWRSADPDADQLRKRLERREMEIQELNHRIANSLQIAVSFLAHERKHQGDERARESLAAARTRLEAVGKLHRYLYQHSEASEVDLKPFLEALCPDLAGSTGLGCSIEADSVAVPAALAQQLAIVVNELAMNARKHGYADGEAGDLRIECSTAHGHLRLSVADDGCGLSETFDLDHSHGLGMTIVQGVAAQLGGSLEAADNNGARFTLTIPFPDPSSTEAWMSAAENRTSLQGVGNVG